MKCVHPGSNALRWGRVAALLAALTAVGACRPDDQRTDSIDLDAARQQRESWAPELATHIDAGNDAIRSDSFDVAREHFLAATTVAPDVAAGWFGLYLAEQGRGDNEAAMEALGRAQSIASGASLIHPQRRDSVP